MSRATRVEEVLQIILLEHFFNNVPQEVHDWVRDQRPLTLQKETALADEFQDAQRGSAAAPSPAPARPLQQPAATPLTPAEQPEGAVQPSPATEPRLTGPRCYGCNQLGHMRDRCPQSLSRGFLLSPTGNLARATACCIHRKDDSILHHFPSRQGGDAGEEEFGILYEANAVQAAAEDNRQHHWQIVWITGRVAQGLQGTGTTLTLVQPQLICEPEKTGLCRSVGSRRSFVPYTYYPGAPRLGDRSTIH